MSTLPNDSRKIYKPWNTSELGSGFQIACVTWIYVSRKFLGGEQRPLAEIVLPCIKRFR